MALQLLNQTWRDRESVSERTRERVRERNDNLLEINPIFKLMRTYIADVQV